MNDRKKIIDFQKNKQKVVEFFNNYDCFTYEEVDDLLPYLSGDEIDYVYGLLGNDHYLYEVFD